MSIRNDGRLAQWVIEALEANDGSASIVEICKHIWECRETELRESGDDFYTWQYDLRWVGRELRREGKLQPKGIGTRGPWRLIK